MRAGGKARRRDEDSKMIVETLKCDVCDKLRLNDSNHWLCGIANPNKVQIGRVGVLLPNGEKNFVHLCGQQCAMKWVGVKIGEL